MLTAFILASLINGEGTPNKSSLLTRTPNDMYSARAVRQHERKLADEYRRRKARLSPAERADYEKRLEYFGMRRYLLEMRVGKNGRLDPRRYQQAIEHRNRMPDLPGNQYVGVSWQFFGPRNLTGGGNQGIGPLTGRVNSVAYDPLNPTTFWVGGATGGVCKTTDFGNGFSILSDQWDYTYVSKIAVDPTNSSRVYVATGDFPGWWGYGMGIMRSTNGGATWINELRSDVDGAEVSDLLVNPDNPAIVLATSGRGDTMSGRWGVWRSTDFGDTWTRVVSNFEGVRLAASRASGGIRRIYAAGTSGRLRRSSDGGATWTSINPAIGDTGLLSVATSTVARDTVFVYSSQGVIYRSTNAGDSWTVITGNFDSADFRQPTYNYMFGCINTLADGTGQDVLLLGLVDLFVDVGANGTWTRVFRTGDNRTVHPDYHGFDRHPTDRRRALVGNDGGVWEVMYNPTLVLTATNLNRSLRLTEHVHASVHPNASQFPDYCLTGIWHNGTGFASTDPWAWTTVSGADGGFSAIDPTVPLLQLSSWQKLGSGDGTVNVAGTNDAWQTRRDFSVATTINGEDFAFMTPFDVIPGDTGAVYIAGQSLYKLKQSISGTGTWTRDIGGARFGSGNPGEVATAVEAVSGGGVFVGTSNGRLFGSLTPSSGMRLITDRDMAIRSISSSPSDADDLLVGVGDWLAAGSGQPNALIEISDALGSNPIFTNRSGSGATALPDLGVNAIVRDPSAPSTTWYAATDVGVYYTDDRGANWYSIGESRGLPNALVANLTISDGILYASTFGRGMWRMPLFSTRPRVTNFNVVPTEETGGNRINVTVTLDRIADPAGTPVTITSNNSSAIPTVVVTVTGGRTSQTFSIDTNEVPADTTVTVTASANGGSDSDTVILRECPVTGIVIFDFTGGDDFNFAVTLGRPAPTGGALVSLVSNNNQVVTIPSSVTVPAGETFVVVPGTSRLIPTNTQVGIQASRPGSGVQQFFTVFGVNATSVTLVPSTVYNGQGFAVRVALNRAAPKGGFPLQLLSSNPNVAQVPRNVTIPQGRSSFDVQGTTSYVATDTNVGIRATIWQVPWENTLLVRNLAISSILFVPNPVVGGRSTQFRLTLNKVVNQDIPITVTQGPRGWTNLPVIVTVPSGRSSVTIPVTTQSTPTGKRISVVARVAPGGADGAFKETTLFLTPPIAPAPPPRRDQ
jgi:photosystem II stability/assembly factor-like uncharacterized protein